MANTSDLTPWWARGEGGDASGSKPSYAASPAMKSSANGATRIAAEVPEKSQKTLVRGSDEWAAQVKAMAAALRKIDAELEFDDRFVTVMTERHNPKNVTHSFQVVWTAGGGPGVVRSSRAVADAYAAFIHGGGDSGQLAKLAASATPLAPTAVSGRKRTAAEAMVSPHAVKPTATPEPEPVAEDDGKVDSDQDDEAVAVKGGEGEEEVGEEGEDVDDADKFPEEDAEYESEGSDDDEDEGQDEDEDEDEDEEEGEDEDERPAKRAKTATWSACAIC